MTRDITSAFVAAAIVCATPAARAADEDAAKTAAVKVTAAGAALFDAKDAKGLAETYADDAVLTVVVQDANSKEFRKETHQGRADIQAYYQNLFKADMTFHAKNTVEHARWIGPDLLLITGVFEPDTQGGAIKLPFVQVRVKQGDAWRISNIQVFYTPTS